MSIVHHRKEYGENFFMYGFRRWHADGENFCRYSRARAVAQKAAVIARLEHQISQTQEKVRDLRADIAKRK